MTPRRDGKEPKRPKFPRRRWAPGQTERAEKPDKGAGYDRRRDKDDAGDEIDDLVDDPPRDARRTEPRA